VDILGYLAQLPLLCHADMLYDAVFSSWVFTLFSLMLWWQ